MPILPRVQSVALPILRARFTDMDDDQITSWAPNINHRKFPLITLRRLGGFRHETKPTQFGLQVVEMTAFTAAQFGGNMPATENLYEDALEALYESVKRQTQTPAGYLHSIKETMGATQFSSLFQDSWRVQGLIQLGVRPPRQT